MYPVVNQAIRMMVIEYFGEAKWEKIRDRAGTEDAFASMEPYDDEITYKLVQSPCEELGAETGDVLKIFGGYGVGHIAEIYADVFGIALPLCQVS
jgi:hypothetical protein